MGNVLKNCSPNGVLLSSVKLNDPTGTCAVPIVKYVAVGGGYNANNSIVISSDSSNWTGLGITIFDNGYSVTYNNFNKKWVAVGKVANSIAISNDGYNWTGLGNTIFEEGYNVIYSNNLYVAVGFGANSIATSNDGINWVGLGNNLFDYGYSVKYANGLWIAVGQGNYSIAKSTDGNIWIGVLPNLSAQNVAYGNGLWIVVMDTDNSIATSRDGDIWTINNYTLPFNATNIAYNDSIWIVVTPYTNTNQIATSTDGITWTGLGNTFFQYGARTINYLNGLWFLGGYNNYANTSYKTIFSSINGNDWIPKVDYTIFNACHDIEYATPLPSFLIVGVGSLGSIIKYDSETLSSVNNIQNFFNSSTNFCRGILFTNPSIWIGVGEGSTTLSASTSSKVESVNWTQTFNNTQLKIGYGIAYGKNGFGNNLWVAVGQKTYASTSWYAISLNGTTWSVNNSDTLSMQIFSICYGVTYANNLWVAVGLGTSHSIATSNNGTQWTGKGGKTGIFDNHCYGISYNGYNLWVAVGSGTNTLATSPDLVKWTGKGKIFDNAGYKVLYANNIWIACGSFTANIARSRDGNIWTQITVNNISAIYGISYSNGLWMAVGNGTFSMITSKNDGNTWTGVRYSADSLSTAYDIIPYI